MSIHYSKLFSKQCHRSPDALVISVPLRAVSLNLLSKLTAHLLHPSVISALCYTSSPLVNASSLRIFAITSCLSPCVAHYRDFDPLITTHRAQSGWPLVRPVASTCTRGLSSVEWCEKQAVTQTSGTRGWRWFQSWGDKVWEHPWSKSDFIDQRAFWCHAT